MVCAEALEVHGGSLRYAEVPELVVRRACAITSRLDTLGLRGQVERLRDLAGCSRLSVLGLAARAVDRHHQSGVAARVLTGYGIESSAALA